MNTWNGMGRLTKDPELRTVGDNNTPVCNFTAAINRRFSKGGENKADFINCVAWRSTAEFICKYFKQGDMCTCC